MQENDFYQATVYSFKKRIQKVIDKKLNNLNPARGYTFTHSKAYEALAAINHINQKYSTSLFLVGGGLLGLIREGKLLNHDYDLDLGFLVDKDNINTLIDIFEKEENFSFVSSSANTVLILYKDLTIDLFGHYSLNKSTVRFSTDIHHWDHAKFDLKRVDFMGTEVLIPDQPERYLSEEYGDWKNIKIGFDLSYHSPNRKYNGLTGLIYLINRLENAIRKGWDSYASMAASALYRNYAIDYRHIFPMPAVSHPADSIKKSTILFVTTTDIFNEKIIDTLKIHYDDTKNFVIYSIGTGENFDRFRKIVRKLSFVTQVISSQAYDQKSIENLFPDTKVIRNEKDSK